VPFSFFQGIPAGAPIPSTSSAIGSPADAPTGFGEPATYVRNNNVSVGQPGVGDFNETQLSQLISTTLSSFIGSLAFDRISSDFVFRYSSSAATDGVYVTWFADFPACDMPGDPNPGTVQYGGVTIDLSFEVFQATP
jgi:hypothetical protein